MPPHGTQVSLADRQKRPVAPASSIPARLELVRHRMQLRTLRDFWRELVGSEEYSVSYEAVRNYHSHRDPPVEYLVRVSRQFGVDLEWLAAGTGEPWPGDGGARQAARRTAALMRHAEFETGLEETFLHYRRLTPLATAVVLGTCDHLHRDAELRARLKGREAPCRSYVGRFVGKALAGPLVNPLAGTVRAGELHDWQLEAYVLGICQACMSLIPNPNWARSLSEPGNGVESPRPSDGRTYSVT